MSVCVVIEALRLPILIKIVFSFPNIHEYTSSSICCSSSSFIILSLFHGLISLSDWVLQIKDLRVGQWKESCIGLTQENSIENSVQDCLPYIQIPNGPCKLFLAYPKWPCVCLKINICITHCMTSSFQNFLCPLTISSDVTYCVTAWSYHSNPNPSSKNGIKENKSKRKIEIKKEIGKV